jgi:hypothetical protein
MVHERALFMMTNKRKLPIDYIVNATSVCPVGHAGINETAGS